MLEEDLGICGDDAEALIVAFGKEFNVDINGFNFSAYFSDEPNPFNYSNRQLKPLTIGHLEKAIIIGRLDYQVMNG